VTKQNSQAPTFSIPIRNIVGYASVRMEAQETCYFVNRIRSEHPLHMPEWKGSKKLKTRRGREAAHAVFDAVRDRSITTVAEVVAIRSIRPLISAIQQWR
jgi:hypothetical protein